MPEEKTFKKRGWIGGVIILPAILVACFSQPAAPEGSWTDVGMDFLGWLVLGAAIFMRLWATLYIGGKKSLSLVTEGPYAACRHPFYVGSLLIALSLALFLNSLVVLVAVLLTAVIYAVWIIPSEERHAIECFGDTYRAYAAATPRFWPALRNLRRPGIAEIKVAAFMREYARVFGCILLGAAAQFVPYCRTLGWWPVWFHLP